MQFLCATSEKDATIHLGLVLFLCLAANSTCPAAEFVAGTVDADTTLAIDANADGDDMNNDGNGVIDEIEDELLPLFAFPDMVPQNFVFGAVPAIMNRGGTEGSINSWSAKSLVRYELSQPIDPGRLYLLELTTVVDGNFTSAFSVHAVDGNNADIQAFDEGTITWNNSPMNAQQRYSWEGAGPEVGRFFRSGPSGGGGVIRVPLLGSQIQSFTSGPSQFATFGINDTENSDAFFASKEHTSGASRLISFDVIDTAASGNLDTGSTYVGGAAPTAGNLYRIVSGHTVTASSSTFAGQGVIIENGALNLAANNADIQAIIVGQSGSILSSLPGNIGIGSTSSTNSTPGLLLNGNLTLAANPNSDIEINVPLRGTGSLTFNGNGAGSDLGLANPFAHLGDIVFAGTGEAVRVGGAGGFGGRILMNSTGGNRIEFVGDNSDDADEKAGTLVFNQPGTVLHNTLGTRLQGVAELELNAPITFDLSEPAASGQLERRFRMNRDLRGSGDITLIGPASAPVAPLLRGSLEVGRVDANQMTIDPDNNPFPPTTAVDYAGTITTQGYITLDLRLDATAAKIVVGQNGVFAMGFQNRGSTDRIIDFGEVVVESGGELNVGYFDDNEIVIDEFDRANLQQAHENGALRTTNGNGRNGNLTLMAGSTTTLQVNGDGTDVNLFDQIFVEGTASLGGTLQVLFDPNSVSPDNTQVTDPNDPMGPPIDLFYVPTLGDTFDIIIASGDTLSADFDTSGTVDGNDLALWQTSYSLDGGADADGDGDSDGTDFLAWQRQFGQTATVGTITGVFSSLNVVDPRNTLSNLGLEMEINYVNDKLVQLVVVSASPQSAAVQVPEPCSLFLAMSLLIVFSSARRQLTTKH